jgi:hypothetical protein
MSEMEVISLQTGCKGVYRRWEFFGGARLRKTRNATRVQNVSKPEVYVRPKCLPSRSSGMAVRGENPLQGSGSAASQSSNIAAPFEPAASRKPIRL